jgi:hypothetical protein
MQKVTEVLSLKTQNVVLVVSLGSLQEKFGIY